MSAIAGENVRELNWTQDETGRENSSDLFYELIDEVARLIRGDAHVLLAGRADRTARVVLAHLAHVHRLTPPIGRSEPGPATTTIPLEVLAECLPYSGAGPDDAAALIDHLTDAGWVIVPAPEVNR